MRSASPLGSKALLEHGEPAAGRGLNTGAGYGTIRAPRFIALGSTGQEHLAIHNRGHNKLHRTRTAGSDSQFPLVIVWVCRRCLVIQKIVCVLGSGDGYEHAGFQVQVEKGRQIVSGTRIRKVEYPLLHSEVLFDESQDAAEVLLIVVDVIGRRIRGNNQ